MSTTPKRGYSSSTTSSFESPYVSIELLSYLKPEQKTPFQVFREVVMPEFKRHLSNGKQFLPPPEENHNGNGIVTATAEDTGGGVTEEDSGNHSNLLAVFDEIQRDVNYIKKACGKLERWEAQVNSAIKDLVFQSLDDAFKERMKTSSSSENTVRTRFQVQKEKLEKTKIIISDLKNSIRSQPELVSLVDLDSDSFKSATSSMTRQGIVNWPVQLPVVNIGREIAEVSTFKEIEAIYNGLDVTLKLCLLCFSVFPENAIIKKKVLVHWWVGEGFIDSSSSSSEQGGKTVEEMGNGYFKDLIAKRIIHPVYKKRRPGAADSCKMDPFIRYAVINLAERTGFVNFDGDRNPTAKFSDSRRAFLVRTKKGSSMEELTNSFHLKQENVQTLFNVSETNFGFREEWFSKMKYVKVLQLGRWQSSVKHLIEVNDSGFLKGLKRMKQLRYLSLRGVSRITELPDSICKLRNLRILNLNGCRDLEKLPDGIGSLEKLTHLDMYECYLISYMPKGLALLSQLQVLKGFVIGKPSSGGDQHYCKLEDLTKLEKLKTLRIHVNKSSRRTDQEQELSCLDRFEKLRSLSISWSRIYGLSAPQRNIQRRITKRFKSGIKSMRHKKTLPSSSPSLPALLEKLDLHYFPKSAMPDWLRPEQLKKLKKLYIRGGDLCDLGQGQEECSPFPWTVKVLRLKFLSKLQMEWREVRALFPSLEYVEKFECPQLSFFPCDHSGVWEKTADRTN